jgi:carbonic anhydrase
MSALFIACSDGRIAASIDALQEKLEQADADRLLVPGGPLVFTRPGMERRVALDCVRTQLEVGSIRTIYVISHQECAAYQRALGGFGFDQQELLERDLARVRRLLENTFPDVDVKTYIIPWRENGRGPAFGDAEPLDD